MKTAVIIVTFNTPKKDIVRLRNEIQGLGFHNYSLYIIDNTGTGRGYAAGVNIGIQKGLKEHADYFLVLNPDIALGSVTAEDIMEGKKYFDVWGMAMEQENRIYYGGEIDRWRLSGGLVKTKPVSRFQSVDFVTGSFMVIKKKVIDEIGFFDDKYFMYYEDVDFCERAKRAGYKIGIDSNYRYKHFETSRSFEKKRYYLARNRFIFLYKYGNFPQKIREFIRIPLTIYEDRIIITTLLKSAFLSSFTSLNISAGISKLLNFILFLVLIKRISVTEYGMYSLIWAHVTFFTPIADFGTSSYGLLYLPNQNSNKKNIVFSLRIVLPFVAIITSLIAAFYFRYSRDVVLFIFLTSLVFVYDMSAGSFLILSSINNRLKESSIISIVLNTVMMAGLILAMYVNTSLSLLFYYIAFFYVSYSVLYFYLIHRFFYKVKFVIYLQQWLRILKKSWIFILSGYISTIYFKINVFLLNFIKGYEGVGIYSSGYKFFEAFLLLVSSYNVIALPVFSHSLTSDRKSLNTILVKHLFLMTVVSLFIVINVQIFASALIGFIFTDKYLPSIQVVKIIVLSLPFLFINSVLLNLLYASKLFRQIVLIFVVTILLNIFFNIVLIPVYSYMAPSFLTVINEIFKLLLLCFMIFLNRRLLFHD